MKNSKMRKREKKYIELYNMSKGVGDNAVEAAALISHIDYCFKIIDAFTGQNHAEIVHRLYFSRDNIISDGIIRTSSKVFLQEKTLYLYRQKYCDTIDYIVSNSEVSISKILIID